MKPKIAAKKAAKKAAAAQGEEVPQNGNQIPEFPHKGDSCAATQRKFNNKEDSGTATDLELDSNQMQVRHARQSRPPIRQRSSIQTLWSTKFLKSFKYPIVIKL